MKTFLKTKRLIITEPSIEFFDEVARLDSDPKVMYYIGGSRTKNSSQAWLEKNIAHFQRNGFGFGFVFEKEKMQFIGRAGLLYLAYDETQPDIEIGYRLHKAFWNKGYATELACALVKWGFDNLAVDKLVAVANPLNWRSLRVLEKIGMHYVGKTFYYKEEVMRYEILRTDELIN